MILSGAHALPATACHSLLNHSLEADLEASPVLIIPLKRTSSVVPCLSPKECQRGDDCDVIRLRSNIQQQLAQVGRLSAVVGVHHGISYSI